MPPESRKNKNWFIPWLTEHKALNVLLVILYSLFLIFLHDPVVKHVVALKNEIGLPIFNRYTAIVSAVILVFLLVLVMRGLVKIPAFRTLKIALTGLWLAFLLIHWFMMLEMKIEIIHAFEYALLAMLIYPLFNRFAPALVFSLPVMITDELYQYLYLYPNYVEYFEINDIVLDMLGAGLGLILIWILGTSPQTFKKSQIKKPEIISLVLFNLLVILGFISGLFARIPAEAGENTLFIFNRLKSPFQFWQEHPFNEVTYHVIQVFEGMVIINILIILFIALDGITSKTSSIN